LIDDPRPPPCARCMRESTQSQCVLVFKRTRRLNADPPALAQSARSLEESASNSASGLVGPESVSELGQQALPEENEERHRTHSSSQDTLTDNVIHTLVSKPDDTLALLFEAAGRDRPSASNSRRQSTSNSNQADETSYYQQNEGDGDVHQNERNSFPTPKSTVTTASLPQFHSQPSKETLAQWNKFRFVCQGWLTAREAVLYIDL
jgi:hypothetical protein